MGIFSKKKRDSSPITAWLCGKDNNEILCPIGYTPLHKMVAGLVMRGLTVADFDRFTFGMLVNYCYEYDRIRNGVSAVDEDRQYKQIKQIEPLVDEKFNNGTISFERYIEFKESLKAYEEG